MGHCAGGQGLGDHTIKWRQAGLILSVASDRGSRVEHEVLELAGDALDRPKRRYLTRNGWFWTHSKLFIALYSLCCELERLSPHLCDYLERAAGAHFVFCRGFVVVRAQIEANAALRVIAWPEIPRFCSKLVQS